MCMCIFFYVISTTRELSSSFPLDFNHKHGPGYIRPIKTAISSKFKNRFNNEYALYAELDNNLPNV